MWTLLKPTALTRKTKNDSHLLEHPGPISFGAPIRHFHPAPPLPRRAAQDPNFDKPTLRQSIARLNHTSDADIETALEEGFRQELARVAQDGLISRDEEEHLRAFRDRLALQDNSADRKALQTLDQASQDHLTIEARLATTAVRQDDQHLQELSLSVQQADLDEEETHGGLVQAAVIRDVTQGIVPQRQAITGAIPFNLMKSEQLVWVLQDVDYLETVVRRERRGSSHRLSIRVARYNDDFEGSRDSRGSRVTFTPTESGTYYARVSGDRDEVGSYTLSVTEQ